MTEQNDNEEYTLITVDTEHVVSEKVRRDEQEAVFELEPGYMPVVEEYEDEDGYELYVTVESKDRV